MRPLLFLLLLMLSAVAYGQRKKKSGQTSGAIAIGPYYPEENKYAPKAKKGSRKVDLQLRYEEQRKKVHKQKRKAERILESPSYGDVGFFGHRSEPRKHKPDKMKWCKTCGIRH